MISRFLNLSLVLIFLTLVSLFVYREMSKPTTASASIGSTQPQKDVNINKDEVDKIVQAYIQDHPEEIVQSLENLQMQQHHKKAQELSKKSDNYIKSHGTDLQKASNPPILGNPDANIKIVTFFDYNCSYCKKSHKVDMELLKQDKNVQLILRPIPILGDRSDYAIKVAMAVWKIAPNIFPEFHADIMKVKKTDNDFIKALVSKYEIDYATIKAELDSEEMNAKIAQNFEFARNMGIKGTPSYVVNDHFIPGLISLDQMKQIIMQIRAQDKK
ncbi:MAG: hypothetical protein DGJ47_000603 [Rickettsiaceae bacterium]